MTLEELKRVLAKVQLGDNRQVDRLTLAEWSDTIGDLAFEDAIEGVRMHRMDSTAYLLPAHVRANVRLIQSRRERAQRVIEQAARRAIPAPEITLDREEFERQTQEAIVRYRAERGAV